MIFLKSLLFIVWNVLIGISLVFLVRWLLFNLKSRFVFGFHIPLTPGFVITKRDWMFNKVRAILHDYLDQADRFIDKHGYLLKWENLVYESVVEELKCIDAWKLLPSIWREKLKKIMAGISKDIARIILRKLIPKLIEQLQIENRIDDFDEKFSSKVLRQYYNHHIHKYLIYFFVTVNVLIGVTNMVLYLIIA